MQNGDLLDFFFTEMKSLFVLYLDDFNKFIITIEYEVLGVKY